MSDKIGDNLTLTFSKLDQNLYIIEQNIDSFAVYINPKMITKDNLGVQTIKIILENSRFKSVYYLDFILPYSVNVDAADSKDKEKESK